MTEIELDRETARAVAALVHRLKNRGDADDEFIAREFMMALRGQGWRPTNARTGPDWRRRSGDGSRIPDESRPGGAGYLAEKAALMEKLRQSGEQQAIPGGDEP